MRFYALLLLLYGCRRQELIERNILKDESYFRDRAATREALSGKLTRRLSLRPTAEELEQRNILYQNTPEERLKEKDMKKKVRIWDC